MFQRLILYALTIVFGVATVTVGLLAYRHLWFWHYDWMDLLVHFLAGATVGLLAIIFYFAIVRQRGRPVLPTRRAAMVVAVTAAVLVGVLWELFEVSIDQYWSASLSTRQLAALQLGFWDTITDLLADLAGGLLAGLLYAGVSYFTDRLKSHTDLSLN